MFDYKGYPEETLQYLCDKKNIDKGLFKWRFWPMEAYSIGRCLREYAGYPSWLALYTYATHGLAYGSVGYPHEVNNRAGAMFVFNEANRDEYRKKSDKPCHIVAMPYAWYRRQKGYEQTPDARGTLVFPGHSSSDFSATFDVDDYIDTFQALPAEFHPVCVSMHMYDIFRGYHRRYIERGIPVYTAGHSEDRGFVDRFYQVLRRFKYTTSNSMGSHAYYSVEMGIPFSLIGDYATFVNESDPGMAIGEIFSPLETTYYGKNMAHYFRREAAVFSGLNTEISDEQREFTRFMMGLDSGLSRDKLRDVMWKCTFSKRNILRLMLLRDLGKVAVNAVKFRILRKRRHRLFEELASQD